MNLSFLPFFLYSPVAKRASPFSYMYIFKGLKDVTNTYILRSYFRLLIKCGFYMYYEINVFFLFEILA